ncbi:MAG TPA: endonuclease/exonuclease/phosphatase family protein [Dokdonella sp.]
MSAMTVVASYNTHGGVGLDRRYAPQRIAGVLAELGADIVALQELQARDAGLDMLALLGDATGYHAIAGPTLRSADGHFGNGLLSRHPIVSTQAIALAVGRREPRGAIDAVIDCDGTHVRVIATHLGLARGERREQVARLLDAIRSGPVLPTVLLGDLNEWLLRGRALQALQAHFGEAPARATFPSMLPLLALDRIWMAPPHRLRRVRAHRSRLARIASDHLPLLADIHWEATDADIAA